MKKKILMVMMICVFGLTGCKEVRTLEVAFKEEQQENFKIFQDYVIKARYGSVTDVDIVENEILITLESEGYQEYIDKGMNELFNTEDSKLRYAQIGADSLDGMIEVLDEMMEDYNGNTFITYALKAPSGDIFFEFSFNEDGLIK